MKIMWLIALMSPVGPLFGPGVGVTGVAPPTGTPGFCGLAVPVELLPDPLKAKQPTRLPISAARQHANKTFLNVADFMIVSARSGASRSSLQL